MSYSTVCNIKKMKKLAEEVALNLQAGDVLTLTGDLGSGKTTFTKMLCNYLCPIIEVTSPTYTYLNIYDEKVAHFDLYRLKKKEDFFALGFDEYLSLDYITIIEWPEIILQDLTSKVISITFKHHEQSRLITINDTV